MVHRGALRVMAKDVGFILGASYVLAGCIGVVYLVGLGSELLSHTLGLDPFRTYSTFVQMIMARLLLGFVVAFLIGYVLFIVFKWYENSKDRFEGGEGDGR